MFNAIRDLAELGDRLLAYDGCLNFFSGPTNKDFSAMINLYNCHYSSTHILGTTGGNTDDLKESIRLSAEGKLRPAVMVTHVGGMDSIVETTRNLPQIPGGKKLAYTQFDMPMTAIDEIPRKGRSALHTPRRLLRRPRRTLEFRGGENPVPAFRRKLTQKGTGAFTASPCLC